MALHVLLVEDDVAMRNTLKQGMLVEGYGVSTAANLAEARDILANTNGNGAIDVIVLDLGLPDGDGASLLAEVRQSKNLPVIIISARSDERHKVKLLDLGSDDYLVKPFGLTELFARMRVALRNRGTRLAPAITRYDSAGLVLDLNAHAASLHGAPLKFTPTEFKLLARLLRSLGQVVTHRQLLIDVWGPEFVNHLHYLRVYMAQLRTKIEVNTNDPQRLITEPGIGYRLME